MQALIQTTLRTKALYLNMGQNSFLGKQGEYLVKKFNRKMQRHLTKPVQFIVIYQTKKVSYFLSKKDKISHLERSDSVYEFFLSGLRSATYIGKTVRNLYTRLAESAKFGNISAISEHLTTCEHARHITDLHNLYDNVSELRPDKPFTNYELIANNTKYDNHSNTQTLIFCSFWKRFILDLKGRHSILALKRLKN